MDTSQSKGRLRAFLKHASVRISSAKGHDFENDSASAYSIDDDGRSQKSSSTTKKDSKLRRLGRGIREWRAKRRRLQGDAQLASSHALDGKSFSSSEGSFAHDRYETDEDLTDEDEPVSGEFDRPEDHHALEAGEDVRGGFPEKKLQGETIHTEVAMRESTRGHHAKGGPESQARPAKATLVPAPATLLPPPAYSSLAWPDLIPHERVPNSGQNGIVSTRNMKRALQLAQSPLSDRLALWADASRNSQHCGAIAVAHKLDRCYTVGVANIAQLESLAILITLQWAVQAMKTSTSKDTVYMCSDSAESLRWAEKVLAIATAIREAGQACALEADMDGLKCLIRLSDRLNRCKFISLSENNYPEKSLTASIGWRILEQYYELRRLGARVEFPWAPDHSGLTGNHIADGIAKMSCWWLPDASPNSELAQGDAMVVPLKMLTLDEPWTRLCPRRGEPQYTKELTHRILEDTKSLHLVLSTWQQPTAQGHCQRILAPSQKRRHCVRFVPEASNAIVDTSASAIKGGFRPHQNLNSGPQQYVVLTPVPQLPPALSQPESEDRTSKKRRKKPATTRSRCTHCGNRGHLTHQCFEEFPELKLALPQRYANYKGRERLEKVFPGAFQALARLHPQLMPRPIHGYDSRYMFGRIGILPHLTPKQCAVWAVRYQDAQATLVMRGKDRWNEAQGDQLD
ncbi:hypothetical protein KVR01_012641 [Diaporthe batatas]|uniref:uncharacterized protein n=1 Tax=Diaporthe batatas TaxID=748121 RepID=UPI001D055A41|nr:uncharacterized protein KVR01_012641 [Diaporthe batatas]KAG8157599.1 hypothetical protein KVR01_012641 [Diaporthe batatas]